MQNVLHAKECILHSAGREDIDVRMLGNGRPFAIEFVDARVSSVTHEQLKLFKQSICGKVTVDNLVSVHESVKI